MFTDRRKNGLPMVIDTSGYGVVIEPEAQYRFPKGHPCCGCVFILKSSKPICMTGKYPDTENCIYAYYKRTRRNK